MSEEARALYADMGATPADSLLPGYDNLAAIVPQVATIDIAHACGVPVFLEERNDISCSCKEAV